MPKEEVIIAVIVFLLPVIGLYLKFRDDVKAQENRMTILERDNAHMMKQVENNIKRLDNHDEQNKILVALTEQVRNLSEDIRRIEKKIG
ncbi:hypothetical protein NHG23_08710 [Aerococcaceae bacterium NML190073]|nr:hypothetical protein [Aerococcaceae bacterium NML190073]